MRSRRKRQTEKALPDVSGRASSLFKSLAVTYSCMPEGHTTIGAQRFHFRVRYGIGWFPLAIAARQTGSRAVECSTAAEFGVVSTHLSQMSNQTLTHLTQLPRKVAKRIGCYMVKPHGQLVLVSSMHYCTYTPSLSTS